MQQPADHDALNEAARLRLRKSLPLILRPRVHAALVVLAAVSWATITLGSLLPGAALPQTGLSGGVERVMAYGLSAAVTRLCWFGPSTRAQVAAFSLASALFEFAQIWLPGRSPEIHNWLPSTAGAFMGSVLARAIVHQTIARSVR